MPCRLLQNIPENTSVLCVSLEMSDTEVFERIIANIKLDKINPLCKGLKVKKNSKYGVMNATR